MAADSNTSVYVVFGADDFLRRGELNTLLRRLLGGEADGLGLTTFDGAGKDCELSSVLDALRTPSLLAGETVVCVRDADEFVSTHRARLEDYVAAPSPDGTLVLECRSFPATTRLYKAIRANKGVIGVEKPKGWNEIRQWMTSWIEDRANAHGCTLERGVASRLYDQVGDDHGVLDNEIEKLATYVLPGKKIGMADVDALVGHSREQTVFKITDAIAERDARKALSLWQQVLATDRAAPYKAIGGLAAGLRKLVQAKAHIADGGTAVSAKKLLRIFTDGGSLEKQLKRFSYRQWEDILLRLLRIDYGSKSGLGNVEEAMEKLIVDLCAA
ncbi:MAG: DNA polymerase III subunit delta [Phycisphaerales bacterium]|nr:DNA polymerase III subunit delta [Phycisphaerales bacterium]MCB9857002.1 DNA polymerase III subunit delta [Phycisphaerales bacterium]MCB9861871.1 DNA polymerase III subunit delta [Phycisphaerales bacterium]